MYKKDVLTPTDMQKVWQLQEYFGRRARLHLIELSLYATRKNKVHMAEIHESVHHAAVPADQARASTVP